METNKTKDYGRVFDLIKENVAKDNKPDALVSKVNGEWIKYSGIEFEQIANQISNGLIKLGIKKDDKIALISPNRPEWNFIDLGVQQLGAVLVPMYPTITVDDYKFIFKDAGVKIVFVGSEDIYKKVQLAIKEVEGIEAVYTFDEIEGAKNWKEVKTLGTGQNSEQLEKYKADVKTDDLLTLIYTSGTTGNPKGVMLTHGNIMSNIESVCSLLPIQDGDRALSFLPLCHIYERTVLYIYMKMGVAIYYAESLETIVVNINEIKPHTFTAVPRLLEKIYDRIVSKGYELKGLKKKIFFWALELGLKYDPMVDQGIWYNFQMKYARKLIFSKWKAALGGNVRAISSGSAALQARLARVFWAAEIPISEGYGLTETSPVLTTSVVEPINLKIGTVGIVIPNVEIKIAQDGEILAKGPNIMKGYYNRPDLTAEVIDADGWFHTGDIGEFIDGKYLKITDRKKEIFKTSGGKYVSPQAVENKLKESIFIEQAIVVGEGQKFPSALIAPNFEAVKAFCTENEITYTQDAEMSEHPIVVQKIEEEVLQINKSFAQYEQVKKIRVLKKLLTMEDGELTPTLKLKRKIIEKKYDKLILEMYDK
jgi:long-chain acyl-CoA synthetase